MNLKLEKKRKIKRLIFDVDGTLITNVNFFSAIEKSLKIVNLFSEENANNFLKATKTYENFYNNYNYKDYLNHLNKEIKCELPENFIQIFFNELKKIIKINENLIKSIEKLSKEFELVLLTNYFSESQMNRLNEMKIGKFFIEIFGEKLIKPNLKIFIEACGKNKPNECVMIGDDFNKDIVPAKKNGINTIFISNENNNFNKDFVDICLKKVEFIDSNLIKNNFEL